jgi:hypothetical protein
MPSRPGTTQSSVTVIAPVTRLVSPRRLHWRPAPCASRVDLVQVAWSVGTQVLGHCIMTRSLIDDLTGRDLFRWPLALQVDIVRITPDLARLAISARLPERWFSGHGTSEFGDPVSRPSIFDDMTPLLLLPSLVQCDGPPSATALRWLGITYLSRVLEIRPDRF